MRSLKGGSESVLRSGLLALQVSLAVGCGILIWQIASPLWSGDLPREIQLRVPTQPPPAIPARSSYEPIVTRNLFAASTGDAAPAPLPPVEKVVASRLRVRLLGTAATVPPDLGVASLEDESTRERLSVRVGDPLAGAIIRRIERGRVVVENAGHLEEIVFDTTRDRRPPARGTRATLRRGGAPRRAPAQSRRERPRSRAASISKRVQQLTERFKRSAAAGRARGAAGAAPIARVTPAASAEPSGESAPASGSRPRAKVPFFQQAQTTPEWSPQGGMLGLRVRDVREGTDVEQAGLRRGDLVTAVNGVQLEQIAQSYGEIRRAINAGEATLQVEREGKSLDIMVGQE